MGMSSGGGSSYTRRSSRRRKPLSAISEINVTPLVDVMLVLLIVFMVAAPLMTAGIPIELPQTSSNKQLDSQTEPLVVTVDAKNLVYLGEQQKSLIDLETELGANPDKEKQIYVRADTKVNYGQVMEVMGIVNKTGFKKIGLVTGIDTESPAAAPEVANP